MFAMPTTASSHRGDKVLDRMGGQLRARRLELRLKQDEAAKQCQIDRSYYGGLERGKRNPTVLTLAQIATGLKTTIAALVAGIDT